MINEKFKLKNSFIYDYFSTLLDLKQENKRDFPQSIIIEGSDTKNSYYFALELARNLNCKSSKSQECTCTDCKWVKSYTHPAINNVSQIHFKPDNDETKTQISTKQAHEIEKSLALSSDYHRFFIFFSSQNSELYNGDYGYGPLNYTIEPLNNKVFGASCANAMLKSIEEPPKNTTFVFLARSREDILSTIVSRSQVFKFSGDLNLLNYSSILPYISDYFNLDYIKAINLSENILKYIDDKNIDLEDALNELIAYLKDTIMQNIHNSALYNKINRDILFISEAIKHSRAKIQDKIVLEALFLKIVRGK